MNVLIKNKPIQMLLLIIVFTTLFVNIAAASAIQDRLYDDFGMDLTGFVELRYGSRLQDDSYEKDESISEGRVQLEVGKDFDWGVLQVKGDIVGDNIEEETRGVSRELNVAFSPVDMMDLKIGRQTLTWGTGDLVFINDLFPKDWKAFFIGRDDEYLKAPSDAIKAGIFLDIVNIDLIWSPVFNGSEYIDGSRLSYWNSFLGRTAGSDAELDAHDRDWVFGNSEFSLRLSKNISGTEVALYGYSGYWKTPEGFDPDTMKLFHPALSVYGASIRSQALGGIGNLEAGYYDSRDDRDGDDPLIRNSEVRFLAGFEREITKDFNGGFQYYLEWMSDYDEYKKNMSNTQKKDEYRHLLTLRLTKLLMDQNLILSLFAYYSPSDEDAYLRPKVQYKVTDDLSVEAGANYFLGDDKHTFFGQFQDNTNAYAGVRWTF